MDLPRIHGEDASHPEQVLKALLELPSAYRVTALALAGVDDPLSYEARNVRAYADAITRLDNAQELPKLMRAITQLQTMRAIALEE